MNPLAEQRKRIELIQDINEVLAANGIPERINIQDVIVTDTTVSDLVMLEQKLSNIIIDRLWPRVRTATVYHYTSREAAEAILNTCIFRLTSILKRYTDDEVKTFCESHRLEGYIETDAMGWPRYKTLIMPNTFYASFVETSISAEQEEYFWKNFSGSEGARLTINITADNPNLRRIVYERTEGVPLKLLDDLACRIRGKYGRAFVLSGISRLCSFYLAKKYNKEQELRAVHRIWDSSVLQPKQDGAYEYIELPLSAPNEAGYTLSVTDVQSTERIDIPGYYSWTKRGA